MFICLQQETIKELNDLIGRLAQLVRALASHARGRRFESSTAHHVLFALLKFLRSFTGRIVCESEAEQSDLL